MHWPTGHAFCYDYCLILHCVTKESIISLITYDIFRSRNLPCLAPRCRLIIYMTYYTWNPRFIWTFHNKNVIVEKMNYTFRTIQSEVSTFNFRYDATDDDAHIGMGVCVVRRIRTQSSTLLSSFLSLFFSTVFDCHTQVNKVNFAR